MKRTPLIAAVALVAVASTAVLATAHDRGDGPRYGQRDGRGPAMMFERFDTDSDGAVTKAELEGAAAAHFAEADANGDGLLSAEEMIAAAEKMRAAREAKRMADRIAKRIEAHDTDGDGMISLEEATAYMGGSRFDKMFDKLDADGDGSVTQAELEALKSTRGYGRNGRHDGHGRHWGHDRDNN